MAEHDLEALYREAQSAFKTRDYARAGELLRQILVIDESYKDVPRLLAKKIKLKRRRWYNHPVLWSALGFLVIVALGFFIVPRLRGLYDVRPSVVVTDTISPKATLQSYGEGLESQPDGDTLQLGRASVAGQLRARLGSEIRRRVVAREAGVQGLGQGRDRLGADRAGALGDRPLGGARSGRELHDSHRSGSRKKRRSRTQLSGPPPRSS